MTSRTDTAADGQRDLRELAALFPAEPIDDVAYIRSQARLEQILATNPAEPTTRTAPLRRRAWRFALIPITAAAAIAIGVTMPGLLRTNNAFANWAAVPAEVTAANIALADQWCREDLALGSTGTESGFGDLPTPTLHEQRGDLIALGYFETGGADHPITPSEPGLVFTRDQVCIVRLTDNGPQFAAAAGSWGEGRLDPLGVHDIARQGSGWTHGAHGGHMAWVTGRVGSDVAKVIFHMPTGDVTATVNDGHFLAWWPTGSSLHATDRTEGYTVTTNGGTELPRVDVDWRN